MEDGIMQLGAVASAVGLFISTPVNLVVNWISIGWPTRPLWAPLAIGLVVAYGLAVLIPIGVGQMITAQSAVQALFAAFVALGGSAAINALAGTAKDKVQETRGEG